MALNTYGDLAAAIPNWLNRSDISPQVPDFVRLAEARLGNDLSRAILEDERTVPITAGVATLPDDVVTVIAMKVQGATYPDVEVIDGGRAEDIKRSLYAGPRTFATIVGREVRLIGATTGNLVIRARCALPSVETNGTNRVLALWPNVYLFGALLEAANFLRDDAGVQLWTSRYAEAVQQANNAQTFAGGGAAKSWVWGVR
jgi:hypothetical protein